MFALTLPALTAENIWIAVGFVGQAIFGLRFVVQWIATERRKKSVVPVMFWYLSLLGSVILLSYAIYLRNPVFIAGFSLNLLIYLRNLYFIHRHVPAARGIDESLGDGGTGTAAAPPAGPTDEAHHSSSE
ncbi:MAG: lipid-A-disaccharide synthase N-terminal domain-containing protein [Planctomycetota bacterium]|jgi:lipid-A-disaccharide synthase-like uncharacterized protein